MTLGPLEFTVIGIDGNNFTGRIADEIGRVVESGTVAIVDIVLITKDADGEVLVIELDNHGDPRFAAFASLLSGMNGLLTQEDTEHIAADLPEDSSALVVLFEHRWAVRLKEAVIETGGFLIKREMIAPEILEIVNAEIEAGRS